MERYVGWSGEWAFYLNNGSIERRKSRLARKPDVKRQFPFEKWYPKLKVVKLVHAEEENQKEICPKNPHAHHLTEHRRVCVFCGDVILPKEGKI